MAVGCSSTSPVRDDGLSARPGLTPESSASLPPSSPSPSPSPSFSNITCCSQRPSPVSTSHHHPLFPSSSSGNENIGSSALTFNIGRQNNSTTTRRYFSQEITAIGDHRAEMEDHCTSRRHSDKAWNDGPGIGHYPYHHHRHTVLSTGLLSSVWQTGLCLSVTVLTVLLSVPIGAVQTAASVLPAPNHHLTQEDSGGVSRIRGLSSHPRQRAHMFDLSDTEERDDEDTFRRTSQLNTLLRTGVSASVLQAARNASRRRDQSEGNFAGFQPWSAWTPCSRTCKQRRHRCRNADCAGGDKLVEKRSCWRGGAGRGRDADRHHAVVGNRCNVRGGRRHQNLATIQLQRRNRKNKKKGRRYNRNKRRNQNSGSRGGGGGGIDEDENASSEEDGLNPADLSGADDGIDDGELQAVVYDLLYYDWTPWTACTRSCKRRRFRVCALRRFCKNTVLMEERHCHVPGSLCEKRYVHDDSDDANATNQQVEKSKSYESDRHSRKRKKKKKPTPPPNIEWDRKSCGLRSSASELSLRIVGGQESREGAWPWQVAIMTRPHREQYCGGVLISPYHVLTAAHCVRRRNPKRKVVVRVGEFDLGKNEGTEQDIRIAEDTVHAAFNLHTIDSDIAVLRLKTPVRPAPGTNYACVPEPADVLPADTLCYAVGWGKMKETHLFGTDRLREAEVPLVSGAKCQQAFEYEITPNQMCAGYLRGGVDTCAGDSGGPLMCKFRSAGGGPERWHVYGVTSFGEGCGEEGKYGIYTRVSNFSKWIEDAMASDGSPLMSDSPETTSRRKS